MVEVFIVQQRQEVCGVFSSLEKAETYCQSEDDGWRHRGYFIYPYLVDEEIGS